MIHMMSARDAACAWGSLICHLVLAVNCLPSLSLELNACSALA